MTIEGSALNRHLTARESQVVKSAHCDERRQRQDGYLYFLIPVDSVGNYSQCHKSVSDVAPKILQVADLSNNNFWTNSPFIN
jgi:hypothetical protein